MKTPKLIWLLTVALLAIGGITPAAAEQRSAPPAQYYLALGDSLPFGYQLDRIEQELDEGSYDPAHFTTGYPNVLQSRLADIVPGIQLVNYSCPGENDVTFRTVRSSYGNCSFLQDPRLADQSPTVAAAPLHDNWEGVYTRPQLDGALAFLASHRKQVQLITFQVFSDDVLTLLYETCQGDAVCAASTHPAVWNKARAHLSYSLRKLRAAAPEAELIVPNYYGTQGLDPSLDAIVPVYNELLAKVAAANGARVADVYTTFEAGEVCELTLLCTDSADYHPSDTGYALMANVIWEASSIKR